MMKTKPTEYQELTGLRLGFARGDPSRLTLTLRSDRGESRYHFTSDYLDTLVKELAEARDLLTRMCPSEDRE
jgi:hypothetical protein